MRTHGFIVYVARRMLFALSFAVCALSSNTYAALSGPLVTIAYDDFNYVANNSLPLQSGGTGWSGAWFNDYSPGGNYRINGTSLTYTGLATTGGSLQWGSGGNQINGNARSLPLINSGVVYLQFLSQLQSGTSGGGTPNVRLTASGTLTGGIGGNGGSYGTKMSILDSGLSPKVDGTSSSTANLSALNLVIVQIDYQNTKTSMWVNPDLSTFNYLNPPATTVVYAGLAPAFDKVALYSRNPTQFDELKVIRAAPGAPRAPTGVTAVAGNQQATVTFTAPASDAGATILGYTVVSNPAGGTDSNAGTTGLTHVMTGLTNGTSYTFTVTATNSAGTGSASTASAGVTPMGSQAIIFGVAPTITVGGAGTVSATGGASGNAVNFNSTNLTACTVNSSTRVVTGVAAGTNNCTITADQAGNTNYSAAPQASLSFSIGAAPVVTPPDPEPTIALLPVNIGGLSTLPAILNMNDGVGPSFKEDLVRILSNVLGQPLQFVEQNAGGTVILRGFNGGNLAFIPYGFQTGGNRSDGIYPFSTGQYQVVRSGQQVTIAPALVNLNQLTALLPGVLASLAGNGAITATLTGVTYVVQAGAGVQLDPASGAAQLVVGADGLLHFIDAQGNNQVLYPAFSEPGALRNILRGMDLASTLSIQLDGTAVIVLNGQRYTLVSDMTLLAVPGDRAGQDWWQESPTRYRVTNVETFPWRVWSQGFTVRQ